MRFILALLMAFWCFPSFATTDVVKTFEYSGGDYSSLNDCFAYFAATYPNFVTSDINGYCISSNSWSAADSTALTISGLTTDSSHKFTATTTGSARHSGVLSTTAYRRSARIYLSYAKWNIIDGILFNGSGAYVGGNEQENNVYSNLAIYNSSGDYALYAHYQDSVRNVIVVNSTAGYHAVYFGYSTKEAFNVSVYNSSGKGFDWYGYGGLPKLVNCISMGNSGDDYRTGVTWGSGTNNNMSEDGTAPGTTTYTSTPSAEWVSTSSGSEDLHLKSGATAIDVGTDLSSTFTTDIDGTTRSGTWDIGADEFVSGAPAKSAYLLNGFHGTGVFN